MFKRNLCTIVLISILLNCFTTINIIAEQPNTEKFEKEIAFFQNLKLISNEISYEKELTRGEFADLVSKVLFFNMDTTGFNSLENHFNDMDKSNPHFGSTKLLKDLGILSGDMFNNFYPYQTISYNDAITILIKALGYNVFADVKGGYPYGYAMVAKEIDLTDDIAGNTVTEAVAVKLLYNSLFVNAVNITGIKEDEATIKIDKNKNILNDRLGIKELTGVLVNNGFTSIDGSIPSDNDKIIIKDNKNDLKINLDIIDKSITKFIGCELDIYIKDNADNDKAEIIYFQPTKRTKITTLNSDAIINTTMNYIEYETEKNKQAFKKINLGKTPPHLIVNGVKKTSYLASDLVPKYGFVECIDNNGDNFIDVVIINDFSYDIIVEKVDLNKKIISCKENSLNSLDFSDESNIRMQIYKNGDIITPSDIGTGDIISIAKSSEKVDNKYIYFLFVSNKTVKGTVGSFSEKDKEIYLDDKSYIVSKNLINAKPKLFSQIGIGEIQTFNLDYMGNIANFEKMVSSNSDYAYLIDLYQETGFADSIYIKFYTTDGKFKTFSISSRIKIDGKSLDGLNTSMNPVPKIDEVIELLCIRPNGNIEIPTREFAELNNKTLTRIIPRPAIVKTNSKDEIQSIDTDCVNYSNSSEEENAPETLKPSVRNIKNVSFNKGSGGFNGEYIVTAETKVIKVPDVDRYDMNHWIRAYYPTILYSRIATNLFEQDIHDEKNYYTMNGSNLAEVMAYDAQAYNVDKTTGVADLLILRGRDEYYYQRTVYTQPLCVYLGMNKYFDEETQQTIDKINYFDKGTIKSAIVDRDKLSPYYNNIIYGGKYPIKIINSGKDNETAEYIDVEPLNKGDIISVDVFNGRLSHIAREVNLSKFNNKTAASPRASSPKLSCSEHLYSESDPLIPFDQRDYNYFNYEASYTMLAGTVMNVNSGNITLRLPGRYEDGRNVYLKDGRISSYIGNEYNMQLFDKKLNIKGKNMVLIEETACDIEHDKCEFKVKKGDISDIYAANNFAGDPNVDGFYKASKIYMYTRRGAVGDVIIINFKEPHNKAK